jgi:ubiquinone/menaquinone biosynthesis C-methylase UbiE
MFHPEGPSLLDLLRQALSSTEEGYDRLAPKFDLTPFRTPDALLAPLAYAIGEPLSIDAALDVMCGTGAAMRVLRPLCRERVVGVDFSAGMLAEADRRLADSPGDAGVELVRADVLEIDYDREFDVATCVGAFGHILRRDEPRLLGNVQRALRPGGRFVFVTAEAPPATSTWLWVARGFNAVMHVRNALKSPPFLMYYLTMLWPEARAKLERSGFDVEARRGLFEKPFERAILVIATKRGA